MRIYEYILVKRVFLFSLFVFIDQLSKYLIRLRQLADGGFYVCNPNISWNISVSGYVFWIFWLAIISFLLFLLLRKSMLHNPSAGEAGSYFLILILSGAVSNIVDRLRFGCVVDFIDLKFWPVFNLADIFIVLGAIFLLVRWRKL